MGYYLLANKTFKTKKEIVNKIRSIDDSYQDYQPITGENYDIITDILKWNSQFKTKSIGMTDIYFAKHKKHDTRCIHIAYGNISMHIKDRPSDDISWSCCLKYIKQEKQEETSPLEFIMPFGTHTGKMFKTIIKKYPNYAKWILSDDFKNKEINKKMLEALEEFVRTIKSKNNMKQLEIVDNNKKMNNTTQSTMNLFYTNRKTYTTPIAQYDLSGNLIRIYNSGKETAKHGYNPQCVSKCVNNKLKLHNNSIFVKIPNTNKAEPKIDPKPYIIHQDNKTNSNKNEFVKETITIKPKGLRIGMFNKQKELLQVFTKIQEIENKFGHASGVFDHLYGKIKTKNKIKNGYNNLYFFRKLEIGQTYTIGEKYDLRKFEKAVPRKITSGPNKNVTTVKETIIPENKTIPVEYKNINTETIPTKNKTIPVENKTITIEELKKIFPQPEPKKRNFIQRFMYLFTGK